MKRVRGGREEVAMRQIATAVDKKKDDQLTSHDTTGESGSRHVADVDEKWIAGSCKKHGAPPIPIFEFAAASIRIRDVCSDASEHM